MCQCQQIFKYYIVIFYSELNIPINSADVNRIILFYFYVVPLISEVCTPYSNFVLGTKAHYMIQPYAFIDLLLLTS